MKNNSVSKIPCTLDKFFYYWLMFTAPLHKLSGVEIRVLAAILKKRYELSLIINEDDAIDNFLFSREVKAEIVTELELNKRSNSFNQTLSSLRNKNVISAGNKLNKRFVPDMSRGTNQFDLVIIFDIKDAAKKTDKGDNKEGS